MRGKYYSCLVLTILLLGLLTNIASADPTIMVTDYELTPSIFMPGDHGTLKVTIKNAEATNTVARTSTTSSSTTTVYTDTAGATLENIWVGAAYDGNGKRVKATLNYDDVGDLAPGTSFDITFEIIAEDGLTEALYFPDLNVEVETFTDVSYPIPINVSNSTVDIISKNVPSKIPIGGSTDIVLSILNNRENSINRVNVVSDEIEGIDFIPESNFIGNLAAYSSEDVTFSIAPQNTGNYNLSFRVDFMNGDNLHSSTVSLPIEVVANYDVAPVLYSFPNSISKGTTEDIRLEVYNAKTEEITGVIVKPVTDVSISPSEYFIGSMDPDDVFSASFDINSDDLEIGKNYTVDFKVSFKQGDNYYETDSVSSSFFVSDAVVQQNNNSPLYIVVFIALLVCLYLGYRFFIKRRHK